MNDIQSLNARHHQIIRLHLAGHKQAEIAKHLGVTVKSVQMVLNSPVARDEAARRRKEVEELENLEIATSNTRSIRQMFDDKRQALAGAVLNTALSEAEDHNGRRLAFDAQKYAIDKLLGDEADRQTQKPVVISIEGVEKLQVALSEGYNGQSAQPNAENAN